MINSSFSKIIKIIGVSVFLLLCVGIVWADSSSIPSTTNGSSRTITDMIGDTVTIPANIDRIVDNWPAHQPTILMLGAEDKLVGTTQTAQSLPFLKKLFPQIATISAPFANDGSANIEEIVSLSPDVVMLAGGQTTKTSDALTGDGVPVVIFNTVTTLDDLNDVVSFTGDLIGDEATEKANQYSDYLQEKRDMISQKTSTLSDDQKLRVVHVSSIDPLKVDGTVGPNTIFTSAVDAAGGINAADSVKNMAPIDIEQLHEWNPDVIIVSGGSTRDIVTDVNNLTSNPLWKDLKAVKNNRVYTNPRGLYLWDRHGVEEALEIQWLAKTLYPDMFSSLDINETMKDFYKKFFNYDLTEEDIQSILNPEVLQK